MPDKKRVVNFKDFMATPYGKGVTAINNKPLRQELETRYRDLDKYGKKVKVDKVYRHNDSYFIHILIPSESERQNFYDVVIKFSPNKFTKTNKVSYVFSYDMKVFSNCPSFTYTFAHVYKKYGILCDELVDKYDKSVYFAIYFLSTNMSYLAVNNLDYLSKNNNLKALIKKIRNTKEIKKSYEDAVLELRKKKDLEDKNKKYNKKEADKKISISNKRETSDHVKKPRKATQATKPRKPKAIKKR